MAWVPAMIALLMFAIGAVATVRAEITLSTDRHCYFLAEPVTLTLALHNSGSSRVYGHWRLDPYLPLESRAFEIDLCRENMDCQPLGLPELLSKTELTLHIQQLEAGESSRPTSTRLGVTKDGRPLLSYAGRYFFRIAHWGLSPTRIKQGLRMPMAQRGQTSVFDVKVPPQHETPALAAYRTSSVLRVAEFNEPAKEVSSTDIHDALAFIRQYPNSLYARPVIEGLKVALPLRVMDKNATDEEREAYEMFKRKEYPDPYVPECP